MQELQIEDSRSISIYNTENIRKIRYAFKKLLYVPEEELKPKIISELISYLQEKLDDELYSLKIFIAKKNRIITGIVVCQIDLDYRSYGRKCGTFGWLYTLNFESCKRLIEECERFLYSHKIKKIRGPINYPKLIGGIGFQIKGFENRMMSGVNYHHPNMRELQFLEQLEYERESKYSCVHVTNDNWKKGNNMDKSIKIRYKTLEEFLEFFDEIMDLTKGSFHSILADAPGGEGRFNEMIRLLSLVPQSHYTLSDDFDSKKFTNVPEFLMAMDSCDLENVITWIPMAFDRKTGELIGLIISLPNLYQIWKGEPLTDANVDTVIISKDHTGKGIFSSLNNIGRIVTKINGITYVEGTTIWSNNERAVKTIFPHSKVIREHVVFQKRI